jgi:hypothetical protein
MADGRIKDLNREISVFSNGDFIAVDGNIGSSKMSKDNLRKNILKSVVVEIDDLNQLNDTGYYRVSSTMDNYPAGAMNGLLVVFSDGESRKVQLLESSVINFSSPSRLWFRVGEFAHNTWGTWKEVADVDSVQSAVSALDEKVFDIITYPNKSLSFDELPNVQTLLNTNMENETAVARLVAYDLGIYNSYYFFAQSDVEVYFDDDVIESANYLAIAWGTNPSGTWVPVPESTTNRRYMQCSSVTRKRKSSNNLPTSSDKLTIPAGSIISFTQRNTDTAKVNINCYPQLTPSLPVPSPTPELKKMKITYVSSSSYKISFGDYECELYRVVNAAADADNWNVVHISHNGTDIIGRWTDIIGPLKLLGDNDFIGGVHGSETTNSLYVYADSKKLTLDSSLNEEFERLTIVMNSTCRRESDKSNAFSRRVCVEITRNKMHISSEFVCISSATLTVTRVTNGGLISANNNVILGCYMNNYNSDGNPLTNPNNQSKNNTHAVVVTSLGTIVVNNLQGKEQENYKGYFELFANEEVPRTKVYFCPLYGTEKSVSAGDSFYGECEYIFEP